MKKNRFLLDVNKELLDQGVVFLNGEINTQSASQLCKELFYLYKVSDVETINIYINSPGGSMSDGYGIIDTMNMIQKEMDVNTICVGQCCSMAAIVLACGSHRYATENSIIMIHQPMSGVQGQSTDIEISSRHILKEKDKMVKLLSKKTHQDEERIKHDIERDYYLNPDEAIDYGLVDEKGDGDDYEC